jgi:hydroxymethylpyrimidine pyrophosphatase-like HAD family hydrolase
MFEVAGLKVAMSNSLDIVKEKADYITGSNNESGVAKAINKFLFNKDE